MTDKWEKIDFNKFCIPQGFWYLIMTFPVSTELSDLSVPGCFRIAYHGEFGPWQLIPSVFDDALIRRLCCLLLWSALYELNVILLNDHGFLLIIHLILDHVVVRLIVHSAENTFYFCFLVTPNFSPNYGRTFSYFILNFNFIFPEPCSAKYFSFHYHCCLWKSIESSPFIFRH